jgi:hypothetical protein
MQAETG